MWKVYLGGITELKQKIKKRLLGLLLLQRVVQAKLNVFGASK